MNNYVFAGMVLLILIVINIVAFYFRDKTSWDIYEADPDKHGFWAILLSLLGTIVGGGMFLATGQMGYEAGIVGYLWGIATFVGFFLVALVVPKLRKILEDTQRNSIVELVEFNFSKRVSRLFCFIGGLIYFFMLAGQLVALKDFCSFAVVLTGSKYLPWALVGAGVLCMFLYPIIGGLRKDITTDSIQVGIIIVAALIIFINLVDNGNVKNMWQTLPSKYLSGTGYGIIPSVGILIFMPGLFLVRTDILQRIKSGHSTIVVSSAMIIAGIGALLFYVLFTTLGMYALSVHSKSGNTASLDMIHLLVVGDYKVSFIIGAFFVAVMSSADTFINNISILLARMVTPHSGEFPVPDALKKKLLKRSRIIAFGAIILALVIAFVSNNFVDLLVGAFSLLLIFMPIIIGIISQRYVTEKGAYYSSLAGGLIFLTLFFTWDPKYAFVPAVLISIPMYIIIYKKEKAKIN